MGLGLCDGCEEESCWCWEGYPLGLGTRNRSWFKIECTTQAPRARCVKLTLRRMNLPMRWSSLEVVGHILPSVGGHSTCKGLREGRWWWPSWVQCYSSLSYGKCQGFKYPAPKKGTGTVYERENVDGRHMTHAGHDHRRKGTGPY